MNLNKCRPMTILVVITLLILSCNRSNVMPPDPQQTSNSDQRLPEWFEALIPAYRALNAGETEKAADLLFEAAGELPRRDWEIYFVAATLFATHGKENRAFEAIDQSILAGMRDVELLESRPEFANLKNDRRWETLAKKVKASITEVENAILAPEMLAELEAMWAADQAAWQRWSQEAPKLEAEGHRETRRNMLEAIEALARDHQYRLEAMIEAHGWPGYAAVGEYGAKLSWAIAQHAPNIFYKEKFLRDLEAAVRHGDANPNHVAELADRIARDTWRKQTYGSSMGEKAPHPIENAAQVDRRRLALGLQYPVEVYASFHGIQYRRPEPAQAFQNAQKAEEMAQSHYRTFRQNAQSDRWDIANDAIDRAIAFYGDLTGQQLYDAAAILAASGDCSSERTGFRILQVLIWRRWPQRGQIRTDPKFEPLRSHQQWSEMLTLLKMSRVEPL